MLNYGCPIEVAMPSEVVPYIHSLCQVDGMYIAHIEGTTTTVDIEQ